MSVVISPDLEKKFIEIDINGKLMQEDYREFVPAFERLISQRGRLRMLVRMHDFHGWSPGAIWEELKFDTRHFSDIERIAFVGDQKWESSIPTFCRPFTRAAVKFFDAARENEAVSWLET